MLTRCLSSVASFAVVAMLALTGCATTGSIDDGESEAVAASEAASSPKGPEARFGRGHGPELVFMALHELDLTDAQRQTIEGVLPAKGDKAGHPMKELGKTLADGVRAGKIDEAAVKAKLDAMEKQGETWRAAHVKALSTLHATLTPAQRKSLVALVEAKMEEHEDHAPMGPPMAKQGHGPMGFMLHGLELRDDQKAAIAKALEAQRDERPDHEEMKKKFEEMRAKKKAALAAFATDTFDANAFLPEKGPRMPFGERMVSMLGAVVPVLDAAQREALATRIEEGPRHFGRGHHGARHEGPSHEAQ